MTLTQGTHPYDNVVVTNNTTLVFECDPLTGAGSTLTATSITIDAGSTMSVNGEGYASSEGTGPGNDGASSSGGGGGGHGGEGGNGNASVTGGGAYGVIEATATLGSGGGTGGGPAGGAGGGSLTVVVTGTLTVNGTLSADGTNGGTSGSDRAGGGGAGGSLFIQAASIAGSGIIRANGGAGGGNYYATGGGGAGGRIVLDGALGGPTVEAFGGTGAQRGAAGTIWQPGGTPRLWVKNGGTTPRTTPIATTLPRAELLIEGNANALLDGPFSAWNATIQGGASLSHSLGVATFALDVSGDLLVAASSSIHGNARGHAPTSGPRPGLDGVPGSGAGGGGHGGQGGRGNAGVQGGGADGLIETPTLLGSGGGNGDTAPGGAGGGRLMIDVTGLLTVDGSITVDGGVAGVVGSDRAGGGGAGGTLVIHAASVAGSGTIRANGGNGGSNYYAQGGGGAGGRIVVVGLADGPLVQAFGGSGPGGSGDGAAGSLWLERVGAVPPLLQVDNNGQASTSVTPIALTSVTPDVELLGSANVILDGPFSALDFSLAESGTALSHSAGVDTFALEVALDLTLAANTAIHGDARGASAGGGSRPGAHGGAGVGGGGGGHGGQGGRSSGGAAGGGDDGAIETPALLGSGGGNSDAASGGSGGGRLVIDVEGTLTVDGRITVNGGNGALSSSDRAAGGGAGGTLVIDAGSVAGAGTISANGGNGGDNAYADGGGGAGGRIVVVGLAAGPTLQAFGGWGGDYGAAGSLWLERIGADRPLLRLANGGTTSTRVTPLVTTNAVADVELAGAANVLLDGGFSAWDFKLSDSGTALSHSAGVAAFDLNVGHDLVVAAGTSIHANGRGFPAASGSRPGSSGSPGHGGGGGGHGGQGGQGQSEIAGGQADGAIEAPTLLGSGGGNCNVAAGGAGGGRLVIDVINLLTVDGTITAHGDGGKTAFSDRAAGGGAGGSIEIHAAAVQGGGTIGANGGAGGNSAYAHGGGGAGGRIVVINLAAGPTLQAFGGAASGNADRGAAGTLWLLRFEAERPDLEVRNSGSSQTAAWTPLLPTAAVPDLVVDGSTMAAIDTTVIVNQAAVTGGAILTHTPGVETFHLDIEADFLLASGSVIDVNGRGYGSAGGTGAGGPGSPSVGAGGGGHGGRGGSGSSGGGGGGDATDDWAAPTLGGSGGGSASPASGGAGGGVVRLEVAGTATIDGLIDASGSAGGAAASDRAAGGGAGGSIRIVAGALSGSGIVRANGGNGAVNVYATAGGGGGGRLHVASASYQGVTLESKGGTGAVYGGAGTIVRLDTETQAIALTAKNGGTYGARTPISAGPIALTNLEVLSGAVLDLDTAATAGGSVEVEGATLVLDARLDAEEMIVGPAGVVTHDPTGTAFVLHVVGILDLQPTGLIHADGKGLGSATGSGAGGGGGPSSGSGGGGYGCQGGGGNAGAVGGATYGNSESPAELGSGGGGTDLVAGGPGAGWLRLRVDAELQLGGTIRANGGIGGTASSDRASGGGSGGAIDVMAGRISGSGNLEARGGNGGMNTYARGGGGGGGRIAVRYGEDAFGGTEVVSGGTGHQAGCAGTVHWALTLPAVTDLAAVPGVADKTVDLTWTEPEGITPGTHVYEMRYATAPITTASWGQALPVVPAVSAPVEGGAVKAHTVTGLVGAETYYFALRASETTGASSALSNVASAAASGDDVPPATVANLAAVRGGADGEALLTWTAPADIGGGVDLYDVRMQVGGGAFDWATATPVTDGVPAPGTPGASETMSVSGLTMGTLVDFAVRGKDLGGNLAAISNLARAELVPPTVALVTPAESDVVSRTVLVRANALDNVAVTRVAMSIDGGERDEETVGTPLGGGLYRFDFMYDTRLESEAAHTLAVTAYDAFGNRTSQSVSVVVDYLAPSAPIITTPAEGSAIASATLSVSGEADLGTTLTLTVDDVAHGVAVDAVGEPGALGASFAIEAAGLDHGPHTLVIQGKDATNTSTPSEPRQVKVDLVDPGAIDDLVGDKGSGAGEVELEWSAMGDDGASGTAFAYEVRYTSGTLSEASWGAATPVVTGVPTPSAPGAGEAMTVGGLSASSTYQIGVKVVDAAGRRSPLSNVISIVPFDPELPTVSFASPAADTHHRATATIVAQATDNDEVVEVRLYVDGVEVALDTATPWELAWDTTQATDGAHTLKLVAKDAQNNSAVATRAFVADNTLPTFVVDAVTSPTLGPVTLSWIVSDNLTPEGDITVRGPGDTAPPFGYSAEGSYAVTLTAKDIAGNAATDDAVFAIDQSPPSRVEDLAAIDIATPGEVALTWSAPADPLSGVASYALRMTSAPRDYRGDGRHGELVLDETLVLMPARTTLVGDVSGSDTALPVASTFGFSPGDEVLVMATQCDAGASAQVGAHTFARDTPLRVDALGLGELELDGPIGASFSGDDCTVLVQLVPNFTRVDIRAGGVLTTRGWDADDGGVIALRARDVFEVHAGGRVDASGLGFRGHALECVQRVYGRQGEGTLRALADRDPTPLGSGGGGGEGDLFAAPGFRSAGGGGGGHAQQGLSGANFGFQIGGSGGLEQGGPALDTVHLGGAGGQGGADKSGGSPGGGGAGGGVLLIGAAGVVIEGEVRADGAAGAGGCNHCGGCAGAGCGMSGGGGGAGGTIWIVTDDWIQSSGSVSASGAAGGPSSGCAADGGLGAPGRIRVDLDVGQAVTTPPALVDSITDFAWHTATPVDEILPVPSPTPGSPESVVVDGVAAGTTHAFALRSVNGVGLAARTSNIAMRDGSAPTVALIDPADGAAIARPLFVLAEVSDDVGVSQVVFEVDDVAVATVTEPPWGFFWDPRALGGSHTIEAIATDAVWRSTSDVITVTVTPAPPLAPVITLPRDGALLTAATTDVHGTAEAGVTVELFVNDTSFLGAAQATTPAAPVAIVTREAEHLAHQRQGCALSPAGTALAVLAQAASCVVETTWLEVPAGATSLSAVELTALGSGISIEVKTAVAGPWQPLPAGAAPLAVTDILKVRATFGAADPSATLDRLDLVFLGAPSRGAGRYSFAGATLVEGVNTLRVRASDTVGAGAGSAIVTVTVDTAPPSAPEDLAATSLIDGFIHLSWSPGTGEGPAGYAVYRDTAPITSLSGLTPVTVVVAATEELVDLPVSDGLYHYTVVALDPAGNTSALSNDASAASDRAHPQAAIAFTPSSPVGPGAVDLVLTPSEPLAAAPLLEVTFPGGWGTSTLPLTAGTGDTWTGTLDIAANQPNGTALLSFVGQDLVGHVGTFITAGASFVVDTVGPSSAIVLTPSSPLAAGTISVTLTTSEPAPGGLSLAFTPFGGDPIPVSLTSGDSTHFSGSFVVTADTGDGPATFAVLAIDAAGNEGSSITAGGAFTILTIPPGPPIALGASKIPGSAVSLTWTAPAEPVVGYRVYRHTAPFVAAGEATFLAQVTATSTLDQPPGNGTWYYGVTARDAVGNESGLSNIASVEADPPPPEDVTDLALDAVSATSLALAWTASANTSGALAGYRAYRNGALVATLAASATGHTFTSLQAALSYTLKITAFDTWNRESLGASLVGYTWLPNPSGVLTEPHDQRVDLAWSAVAPAANLQHYAIYQAAAPFSDVATMSPAAINPGGTEASITGLENGAEVCFAITAVNKSGAANPAVTSHCTTPSDLDGPPAPASLLVANAGHTTLSVSWIASAGGDVAGYRVYLAGALVQTTSSAQTSATVSALAAATAYPIAVRAIDFLDNEGPPAEVTGYTLMPHPSFTATGHDKLIALAWTPPTPLANVQGYRIYVRPAPFASTAGLTPTASANAPATSFTVTGRANGTTYHVAVATLNQSGFEDPAVSPIAVVPVDDAAPEPPSGLVVLGSAADSLLLGFTPSADTAGDLAGYNLYVDDAPVAVLGPAASSQLIAGLTPAQRYTVALTAFDGLDNESARVAIDGYTWLPHPTAVTATARHEALEVSWVPPAPLANVLRYALYAETTAFTSVAGLTPRMTALPSATSAKLTGLANDQTYHVAVTTVNRSLGQDPAVTPTTGTPLADTSGPELSDLRFSGQPFGPAGTVATDGVFSVAASDPQGVSHVRFLVDAKLIGIDVTPSDGLGATWLLDGVAAGPHHLKVEAFDKLSNTAALDVDFTVAPQPPAPPVITLPADGSETNQAQVLLVGNAERGSTITAYLDDAAHPVTAKASAAGAWSLLVALAPGPNLLQASASNQGGEGLRSSAITVTLDDSVPPPPRNPSVTAKAGGELRLTWLADGSAPNDARYHVYRDDAPFDDLGAATRVTATPTAAALWLDLPPEDGAWHYRVTTLNRLGTESPPSDLFSGIADSAGPRALAITYTPGGAYDEATGRYGVGPVDVRVTFDEPLASLPFLSFAVPGGLPMGVSLQKESSTVFQGTLTIQPTSPGGTAMAVLSARDVLGNRGADVLVGGSLLIDTSAPEILALTLDPANPLKNDSVAPLTVSVTLLLDEALPEGEAPQLDYTLSSTHPGATPVTLAQVAALEWTGGFTLPSDAGIAPETLAFSYLGLDDLANESTSIHGPSSFEVYQGELPPLGVPVGVKAVAKPGGYVDLTWIEVPGAAEYQVYRQAPGEGEATAYTRVPSAAFYHAPGADGTYYYAVASVRLANQTESLSSKSTTVSADIDGTPPGAPEGLALSLVGNGIKATWLPPAALTEPVTYSLYRDDVAAITDISGLTPIGAGIDQLVAVDPQPSASAHAYVVVALDAAGNLSPLSNSAYLNPTLFPVRQLKVEHVVGTRPVVSWTHPGDDLAYVVTIDGDELPDALTATSVVDTTYSGGLREYAVRAVDAAQHESPDHAIALPVISVVPDPDAVIERGLLTPVRFTLTAESDVAGVELVVRVDGKDHRAAPVDLVTGAPQEVTVVIGGYPTLTSPADATLTAGFVPEVEDEVMVVFGHSFTVVDRAYTLDLETESFIRGISGRARLVFHNTSQQEVELVTATGSGSAPSNEIRFTLTDPDGNVYSTATLKQTVGAQLLTLASGHTVVRVAPGASFTSDPVTLAVPANAPDTARLKVQIDAIHHALGRPAHVQVPGLSASTPLTLAEPPYHAVIDVVTPALSYGDESIVIRGRVLESGTELPVAAVPVKLVIAVSGFERSVTPTSDAAGAFAHTFTPLPGEGGLYSVRASHPQVSDKVVQGSFQIDRVAVAPSASLNLGTGVPLTFPLRVVSTPGAVVTNLRIEPGLLATGLTVDVPPPLAALTGGQVNLDVTVTGVPPAPRDGQFTLEVVSDERHGLSWGTVLVSYHLSEAEGVLAVTPSAVETGLARDELQNVELALSNKGLAAFSDLQLMLLDEGKAAPAPAWAFIASAKNLPRLQVGETLPTTIALAPTAAVALTPSVPYTFWLRVVAGGLTVQDVPIFVWVDDSGFGTQLFKVEDIYTGTLDSQNNPILGVAGARIALDRLFGSVHHAELVADATGEALFDDLPTGTYRYRVTATGHDAFAGNLSVRPGLTGSNVVFLSTPLVTIEWSVTETPIEDVYTIVLTAEFETDVPAAVVVPEPPSVALPDMVEGEVFYGEYDLVNYGLVRADEVEVQLPPTSDYRFELLVTPPRSIAAKSRITIPYRVVRLADEIAGASSGGDIDLCTPRVIGIPYFYGYKCANGQWVQDWGAHYISIPVHGCISVGGSGGKGWVPRLEIPIGPGGGGGTGPGGGWCCRPPEREAEPVVEDEACDECEHPELSDAEKECCKYNKKQPTGSQVDVITGDYEDAIADLPVSVLGYDLELRRTYDNGVWGFELIDERLRLASDSGGLVSITRQGTTFVKEDEGRFRSGDATITVETDPTLHYQWSDGRGRFERFAPSGSDSANLTTRGDALGRKLEIVRDGATARLLDTFANQVATWELDGEGHVTAVEAADGRRVDYTWTAGRLTQVKDVLGELWSYVYDGAGRITSKSGPDGSRSEITYTPSGNVASIMDQDGHGQYFTYGFDEATQQPVSSVLLTDGTVIQRWYDNQGFLLKETVDGLERPSLAPIARAIPDSEGRVMRSETADGAVYRRYGYDAYGRRTSVTDARGVETRVTYDDNDLETRRVFGAGRSDALAREQTFDAWGRKQTQRRVSVDNQLATETSFTHDDAGNVVTLTDDKERQTVATFDMQRRPLSVTYPNGDGETLSYDDSGRLLTHTFTPAVGEEVVLESNQWGAARDAGGEVIGRRQTQVDIMGREAVADYDPEGRLRSLTDAWGRTTSFVYDERGREVRRVDDDGLVHETAYEVLDFGFSRTTERSGGEVVRVTERDAFGRVVREVAGHEERVSFYDGASPDPREIATPGMREILSYDSFGNVVSRSWQLEGADTVTETYAYAGKLRTEVHDPMGGVKVFSYNANDLMTRAEDGRGFSLEIEYDRLGRPSGLVDGLGHRAVALAYDAVGKLATRTFADGMRLTYGRDARDRVTSESRSDGSRVDYALDVFGRLASASLYEADDPSTPAEVRTVALDGYGRLLSHANAEVAETTAWDDLARAETVTVDFGPFAKSFTVTRDARGRTQSLVTPDGATTTFAWTPRGHFAGAASEAMGDIAWGYPTVVSEVLELPGGTVFTMTRDALGRPRERRAVSGGETLMDWDYLHDGHHVVGIATESGSFTYDYNGSDEIVGATYPTLPPSAYTYDAAGHRIADAATAAAPWTYNAASQLQAIGAGATFTWDARGNLSSRTLGGATTTYTWDVANQLVAVHDAAGELVASYGYDSVGRRTRKTVGGVTTYYLWGNEGLLAEYDEDGNELVSYLWAPGFAWGEMPLGMRVGGEVYYFLTDALGAPKKLVDEGGQVVWSVETSAFGLATIAPGSSVSCNLRGSSQYFDAETGLHYNLSRYYDPALGRYLSRDPLFETSESPDLYNFALNDPVRRVDRNGWEASGKIGGNLGKLGGEISVGGYEGLGGEAGGGAEASLSDCCFKPEGGGKAFVLKDGQGCIKTWAFVEGGIGFATPEGGKLSARGVTVSAGAQLKIVTVRAEVYCQLCTDCGAQGGFEGKCCFKICVNGPELEIKVWFLYFKAGLGSKCRSWCTDSSGGPEASGPDWDGGWASGGSGSRDR